MRQYLSIILLVFISILLTSCTYRNAYRNVNLAQENWKQAIDTNPEKWKRGADRWFFTGDPNIAELQNRQAPPSAAMTISTVQASDFTKIKVNGDFQTQIFGTDEHNSVFIYGPNEAIRCMSVMVRGQRITISQTTDVPANVMKKVIVRIGIRKLTHLSQMGSGSIEAIRIQTNTLVIRSTGSGNIYLIGCANLKKIVQDGTGSINIFGANTPSMFIKTTASGTVNVAGNVGIKSIIHRGGGDINIIGANSDGLSIDADCGGKIGIYGTVNLKRIYATDGSCIYISNVRSHRIDAMLSQRASVGLAGIVKNLYVNTSDTSYFGGRYLCAENIFAHAYNQSHINLNASKKVFATADQASSIYFFGPAHLLTSFTSGDGVVLAMGDRNGCNAHSEYRPYSYTYTHKSETLAYYEAESKVKRKPPRARYRPLPSQYIK